jgi:hypothetical protein
MKDNSMHIKRYSNLKASNASHIVSISPLASEKSFHV